MGGEQKVTIELVTRATGQTRMVQGWESSVEHYAERYDAYCVKSVSEGWVAAPAAPASGPVSVSRGAW